MGPYLAIRRIPAAVVGCTTHHRYRVTPFDTTWNIPLRYLLQSTLDAICITNCGGLLRSTSPAMTTAAWRAAATAPPARAYPHLILFWPIPSPPLNLDWQLWDHHLATGLLPYTDTTLLLQVTTAYHLFIIPRDLLHTHIFDVSSRSPTTTFCSTCFCLTC